MLLPFKKVSKQAIAEFERQYMEACKKYYAEQNNYSQDDKVTGVFNTKNAEKGLEEKYEIWQSRL